MRPNLQPGKETSFSRKTLTKSSKTEDVVQLSQIFATCGCNRVYEWAHFFKWSLSPDSAVSRTSLLCCVNECSLAVKKFLKKLCLFCKHPKSSFYKQQKRRFAHRRRTASVLWKFSSQWFNFKQNNVFRRDSSSSTFSMIFEILSPGSFEQHSSCENLRIFSCC